MFKTIVNTDNYLHTEKVLADNGIEAGSINGILVRLEHALFNDYVVNPVYFYSETDAIVEDENVIPAKNILIESGIEESKSNDVLITIGRSLLNTDISDLVHTYC